MAKDPEENSFDRTVLPLPDPPFRGRIEEALKDSTPDFPEPVRAPEGAPRGCVRRAGAHADLRPLGRAWPEVHQLSRHGRVRGVACLLADRA